jgi:hypothetical protein
VTRATDMVDQPVWYRFIEFSDDECGSPQAALLGAVLAAPAFLAGLYQLTLIMTHRDGFSELSARSLCRGDAAHRETEATLSESAEKPSFRSSMWVIIIEIWY